MNSTDSKLNSFIKNVLRFEKSNVVTQTRNGIQKNFTIAANTNKKSFADNNVEYYTTNKSPGGCEIKRYSKQKECKQKDGLQQIRLERVYFSNSEVDDTDKLMEQNRTDIQRKTEKQKPVIFQALQGGKPNENEDYTTIVTNASAYYPKKTLCVHSKGRHLLPSNESYFNNVPRVIPERGVTESFLNKMEHVSEESPKNVSAICYCSEEPHQMFRYIEALEPQTGCSPFKNTRVINTAQLQPLDDHELSLYMVQEKPVPIKQLDYMNTAVPAECVINTSPCVTSGHATACNTHNPFSPTLGSTTKAQFQNKMSTSWEYALPTDEQYSAPLDVGMHKYESLSGLKLSNAQEKSLSKTYEALTPKLQNVCSLHGVVTPSEPKPVGNRHVDRNSNDTYQHSFDCVGLSGNHVFQFQHQVHSCNHHLNTIDACEGQVSKRMRRSGANRSFQNKVLQFKNNSLVTDCAPCENVKPGTMYSKAFKQQNCLSKIDHLAPIMIQGSSASRFSEEHFRRPRRQRRKTPYRTRTTEAEYMIEGDFDSSTKPLTVNAQKRAESKTEQRQGIKISLPPKLISPESSVEQRGYNARSTDQRESLTEPYLKASDTCVLINTPSTIYEPKQSANTRKHLLRHGTCGPKQVVISSKAEKQNSHARCPKRKFEPSISSFRLEMESAVEERFSVHVSQPDWVDSLFKWSGVSQHLNKKQKRPR